MGLSSFIKAKFSGAFLVKSGIFFITRILGIAIGFYLSFWLNTLGGAKFWGSFTLYYITLNIILIFSLIGLDSILVKYVSEFHSKKQQSDLNIIYWKALGISLAISIMISSALYFLVKYDVLPIGSLNLEKQKLYIILASLPGLVLFTINTAAYRGFQQMISFGFLKNIALLGGLFLGSATIFYLFEIEINIQNILKTYLVSIYSFSILSLLHLLISKQISFDLSSLAGRAINLTNESMPLMLVASMTLIVAYTDVFMIGYLKDETQVGIYDIAIKYSSISTIFLAAINAYVMPKFAELFGKDDYSGLHKIIRESSMLIFWSSTPLLIIALLFAPFMMNLYGMEYAVGIIALRVLIISQFVSSICGSVGYLLQMTNNQVIFRNIFLGATILNVGFNYLLIPIYGINGAAIASLISTGFWNILSVIVVKRRIGVSTIYLPFLNR